ncbi:ankyrin repeat-containing domain protein, partial [Baffinella frigidus]
MRAETSALWTASEGGLEEEVSHLIARDAGVEGRGGSSQCSPLAIAALRGHIDIARLLLAQSADVSSTDSQGQTVLHMAVMGGKEELILLLLRSGADTTARTELGTALHLAASAGMMAGSVLLLNNGAALSARNCRGQTPEDLAFAGGH